MVSMIDVFCKYSFLTTNKVSVDFITYSNLDEAEVWICSDGEAYFVRLLDDALDVFPSSTYVRAKEPDQCIQDDTTYPSTAEHPTWQGLRITQSLKDRAMICAMNNMFSMIAIGSDT